MKQQFLLVLPFLGAVSGRAIKRQVPFEHAHQDINNKISALLAMNNPDEIQDPIFGLLGAAAGIKGAGKIKDADCLQQATADQAFTNAKAAGNVDGMVDALIFRALERNTASVGLKSVPCTSIKAVNPEIAALQQHQDAAADGAIALNKQIAGELARQIVAVGGDPTRANEASTFAPGKIGDPTAKGNTCDDATDNNGCINTLKLRVDDLSADEIQAAVAGTAAGNSTVAAGSSAAGSSAAAASGSAAVGGSAAAAGGSSASTDSSAASAGTQTGAAAAASGSAAASSSSSSSSSTAAAADSNQAGAAAGAAGAAGSAALPADCNAAIKFGPTSDGRKGDAFEPADLSLFNHGSANGVGIITSFICSQITNRCKVGADVVAQCNAGAQAASSLTGEAAADAFNKALGL